MVLCSKGVFPNQSANLYANLHQAGEDCSCTRKPTISGDIKTFLQQCSYGGAWGGLPIDAFWHPNKVVFKWLQESISQTRFEQIQRYFHISDPRMNAFEPEDSEDEALYNEHSYHFTQLILWGVGAYPRNNVLC
jgi:hypothetical protein